MVKELTTKEEMDGILFGDSGSGADYGYGATQTHGGYCSRGVGGSNGSFGIGRKPVLGEMKE